MSAPVFTFVNATGTPDLSQGEARRMRAHITKTNFAKRRQRRGVAGATKTIGHKEKSYDSGTELGVPVRRIRTLSSTLILPASVSPEEGQSQLIHLLSSYWSRVHLNGTHFPSTADEVAWIQLISSEPAFIESSMGIGARHWSPDGRYQEMACKHWSNATNMIIDRITSGGAYTDPVLGTVVTMAFGERLSGNEAAWHIHVDGLAQLIRERRLRDGTDLPQWFYDVSILDSTNALLNFPRTYHPKVVEEVVKYGRRSFCDVADICNNLLELREQMKTCDDECSGVVATNQDFGPFTYRILGQAWALRSSYASPSIHITSLTVELVLHLIWPRQPETDVTPLAKQLQEALMSLPVRPCSYMDLTSRQLMIGAIVARPGSETRMWFVEKIRKAVVQLKSRGWEDPLEIIRKGSADIPRLSPYIKNLLDELSS